MLLWRRLPANIEDHPKPWVDISLIENGGLWLAVVALTCTKKVDPI